MQLDMLNELDAHFDSIFTYLTGVKKSITDEVTKIQNTLITNPNRKK